MTRFSVSNKTPRHAATVVAMLLLLWPSFSIFASGIQDISAGNATSLVSRCRGSVVIFHIYAAWCGPCREELPDVNRIGHQYSSHGLVLLAFSMDSDPDALAQFLGNGRLAFTPFRLTIQSKDELRNAIAAIGGAYRGPIPYTAIFDKFGRLADEWTGSHSFEHYRQVIEPLLAKEGPTAAIESPAPGPTRPSLDFALRQVAPFTFVEKKPRYCSLTRSDLAKTTDAGSRIFLAASAYMNEPIADKKQFMQERIQSTGGVKNLVLQSIAEIRIDNLQGYEAAATATDTDLNKPIVVYQVILFAEGRYYIMQGFTFEENRTEDLQAFRSIAQTLRR